MGTASGPDNPNRSSLRAPALHQPHPCNRIYSLSIPTWPDSVFQPLQEDVLRLLLAAPSGLSAPAIRDLLKPRVSQPTLWRALERLRSQGRVTTEGRARATRYYAAKHTSLSALRSRRLHQSVARRLAVDPSLRELARERLLKLRQVNPHGRIYHDRWEDLLNGPLPRLLRAMTEVSEQSDAMRQESPFSVLVTAEERRRAFEAAWVVK